VASGAGRRRAPIVFVVDDDVSVRESLELLIRFFVRAPRDDGIAAWHRTVAECLIR
jgi:hypothetical protein